MYKVTTFCRNVCKIIQQLQEEKHCHLTPHSLLSLHINLLQDTTGHEFEDCKLTNLIVLSILKVILCGIIRSGADWGCLCFIINHFIWFLDVWHLALSADACQWSCKRKDHKSASYFHDFCRQCSLHTFPALSAYLCTSAHFCSEQGDLDLKAHWCDKSSCNISTKDTDFNISICQGKTWLINSKWIRVASLPSWYKICCEPLS